MRLLGFEFVLNGVGRYGQGGWRSIPGAEASVESGPLGVVLIAEHVEGFPRDPTDFRMALCLFPYVEDWSLWLVQIPLLRAGPGDFRNPPFLGELQHTNGPVRLGLEASVDMARDAGHRLATDGIKLFGRYLALLAQGNDPTDRDAWL